MTKIKNTKKGMAKKTLSISLAVAMLATSNVPVWAAEDLFTDGDVAVEAFTSEEAPAAEEVVEAPVVETEEVVDAQAEGDYPTEASRYLAEFEDVPSSMEWDETKAVKVRVYDKQNSKYVTNDPDIKVRWCDEDGQLVDSNYNGYAFDIANAATEDGFGTINGICFKTWAEKDASIIGKSFRLQVINVADEDGKGYAEASTPITVEKVTIKGEANLIGSTDSDWNKVIYTGKSITTGPTLKEGVNAYDKFTWTKTPLNNVWISETLAFNSDHKILGKNIVDAMNISKESLTSVMTIDAKYYRGEVSVKFAIEPKYIPDLDAFKENIEITLPQNEYEYTGARIEEDVDKAIVTDLNSGKIIKNALNKTKSSTIWLTNEEVSPIGDCENVKAWINKAAPTLGNFVFDTNFNELVPVTGDYKVIKRDLNNAASTQVYIKNVNNEKLTNGAYITASALKGENLVIKDLRTGANIASTLGDAVKLSLASDPLNVETGKSYSATVETANDKLVTGKVNVDFLVVAHDLADAIVEKETELKEAATYTGSQITKGITAENFAEKVGTLSERNGGKIISANEEYSTTPEFGENLNAYTASNTNVGEGKIIIKGINTRKGTQREITFAINPRTLDKVNVPATVPFDESIEKAEDYGLAEKTTVTATFKDEWTKEKKTLTAPETDYKITYKWLGTDGTTEVAKPVKGGYILTTVERNADTVRSNFAFPNNFTGKTKLVKREITSENVILNKDTYTYTGKDAEVDFSVMYNGEKLEEGVDFDAAVVNGKNVGEGTLVITGKGDYDESSVSVKFNIVPAKTSDVKVTLNKAYDAEYDGTQKKPAKGTDMTLTLNGVDVSSDFRVSYPTSKTANINAGNGEVILTLATKNFDANGTATFEIKPATLENGTLKAYNEKESLVKWYNGTQNDEFVFTYDGSRKEYTKTLYKAAAQTEKKVVTENDYEIKYADNVHGLMTYKQGNDGRGFALVIAKGNYVNEKYNLTVDGTEVVKNGVYTCEDGTKIENVVKAEPFLIKHLAIHKSNVTVANAQYKGGKEVDPVVTINYNGKTLVEGVDFKLDYTAFGNQNRTDVTNGKTLKVKLAAKGGYYFAADGADVVYNWGIDKFDLANAEILISGTDAAPVVKVINRGVVVDADEYTVDTTTEEGKAIITAKADSKNYTGSQKVDIKVALDKPEAPMLEKVTVNGNKATAILSGECEGAIGYDYVISTDKDCITNKDYDKVNKNILKTTTDFTYVQQGTYYAYCHAWTRDENGQKVFSDWSNAYPFVVGAITPSTPVITSVKASGSTVTVKYTAAENAAGYDVVLGTAVKTVAGEKRPVEYGTLVKKNIKDGVVTATFKNVPKGTYYAGLHAFNRTNPENNTKVFSPWSNTKKVTVK